MQRRWEEDGKKSHLPNSAFFLLVSVLADNPGQLKAGFDPKAQGIRNGDPGKHCFSMLAQSPHGSSLAAPN